MHTYTIEERSTEGTTLFKIVLGLILGIAAVICVSGAYFLDEITKAPFPNKFSIYICGRESVKSCSGNLEKCEDALIYGYNIAGTGIDGDDDVTIKNVDILDFETWCDFGIENACTQLDAGLTFQILNIASIAFGGLGLFVLLIPDTRHGTVALFVFGAVTAAAAFGGFLFVLRSFIYSYTFIHVHVLCLIIFVFMKMFRSKNAACYDQDDDWELAASCYFDIAAIVLYVLASIATITLKQNE